MSDTEKVIGIKQAVKCGYIECHLPGVADFSYPTSKLRRGRVQGDGKVSPTITTMTGVCKIMTENEMMDYQEQLNNENCKDVNEASSKDDKDLNDYLYTDENGDKYGVFKLTPRECLRLMGVGDTDIDKMMAVNSNTQCYKQAGNSIVVPVLMGIFSQLNIKGVTPWNEMSDEQRYELIDKAA